MTDAPTRKVDARPLASAPVRLGGVRRRLWAVAAASAVVALSVPIVNVGVARADGAQLVFSGNVTPPALGGHVGLDALAPNDAKLCLAANNTGCPGGYTSAIAWNAAGQLPGLSLPAGTTTAHLEL